jgi:hypothetical protein
MECTLGPQLWVDWFGSEHEPCPDIVSPVEDDPLGRPAGGIWTSTMVDGSSLYVERMQAVLPPELSEWHDRAAWVLEPRPAELLVIEDRSAEADFVLLAPSVLGERCVWPQIAARFEGAHMTTQGALSFWRQPAPSEPSWLARMGVFEVLMEFGYGTPLDWWEAESAIWFGWQFSAKERIADIAVPAIPEVPRGHWNPDELPALACSHPARRRKRMSAKHKFATWP